MCTLGKTGLFLCRLEPNVESHKADLHLRLRRAVADPNLISEYFSPLIRVMAA